MAYQKITTTETVTKKKKNQTGEPSLEGSRIPSVIFRMRVRDETIGGPNPYRWQDVTSDELFRGKKIVMFAVPGAFTPVCDSSHLPGYEQAYEDFIASGADDVYCISVNDAFVMNQWGKSLGISKVKLIPDGSGLFTRGLGMLVRKDNVGYGERTWRYSAFVVDGVVEKAFVEKGFMHDCPDDPFEVSDAGMMLEYLRSR